MADSVTGHVGEGVGLRRPVVDLGDEEARRALVLKWGSVPDDVIPAWAAEMDYALDPVVREALLRAVRDGVTGYPEYGTRPPSPRRTPGAGRLIRRAVVAPVAG